MKRILICTLFVLVWFRLASAEVTQYKQNASPKYPSRGDKANIQFRNDVNLYTLSFTNMPADPKQDPGTDIGMTQPHHFYNFPGAGFLNLRVNGIPSRYLIPKEIKINDKNGTATADILFNFDGTRIIFRFKMIDGNPLLFLTLIHDPASKPVKSMELNIQAYPSVNQGNARKSEYQREIVTKGKIYKVDNGVKWLQLDHDSTVLDLIDRAQQPPNNPKSQGPCAVLADWKGIKSGKACLGKSYFVLLRFILKPSAGKWRFAFFEQKKQTSNDDYFTLRKKNHELFAFPE